MSSMLEPGAARSNMSARERYTKYAKSIFLAGAPNDAYKKVVGLPIEIVPEKDPYALKPGDSLPVRVPARGAPAAGLRDPYGFCGRRSKTAARTSADGRISIPLAAPRPLPVARASHGARHRWIGGLGKPVGYI